MIGRLFRRGETRRRLVETLHLRINAVARTPDLYRLLGIPDTVEGRFESLCLHTFLVLRRLRALPAPASDVAQDLVDTVFAQLDASLREMGVGDVAVPKRMKSIAAAFYGRLASYDAAFDESAGADLSQALARNVLGLEVASAAQGLAAYVSASARALDEADLDALLTIGPLFPAPDAFLTEGSTR